MIHDVNFAIYVSIHLFLSFPQGPAPVAFTGVIGRLHSGTPNIHRTSSRQGSARYNISRNREIQKLPLLKGQFIWHDVMFIVVVMVTECVTNRLHSIQFWLQWCRFVKLQWCCNDIVKLRSICFICSMYVIVGIKRSSHSFWNDRHIYIICVLFVHLKSNYIYMYDIKLYTIVNIKSSHNKQTLVSSNILSYIALVSWDRLH